MSAEGSRAAPVRVLFVSPGGAGGAELAMTWLIDSLGHEWVGPVVLIHEGQLAEELTRRGHGVEQLPVDEIGLLASIRRLRGRIRSAKPGIIHANGFKAAALSVLASLGTGVPTLWVKVDLARDGWQARIVGALCQQVVAVSEAAAATFGYWLRRRVSVVPNGVPEREVDRQAGRAALVGLLGCPPRAPVVVLSGRLFPGKGQLELLDAAPAIARAQPGVRFALLGGKDHFHPDYERRLRTRAAELGIDEAVAFLGHRDDAVRLVSGADVLVAPSTVEPGGGWREGFGLMVAEAFLVGTPVVAYRSGSLPEVVGDCGLLVDEGDKEALAGAVVRLLESPEERARLAACGQRRAHERYRLVDNVEGMRQRYISGVDGRRWRPRDVHRPASAER